MSNCCPEFYPIKVSQLSRYKNIDLDDFLLVIESGSANYSRRSTIIDLIKSFRLFPTGSYSGSFSGSFYGKVISKNANLTGALSGSYQGSIISKNTIASGSFSGSHYGKLFSKNTKATGSFSGNIYGIISGSLSGGLISKNTKATGSFSGSIFGNIVSKNTKASGSFSGSIFGKVISKNIKATGSLSGSLFGTATNSFTSSYLKQSNNNSYKFTYFDGNKLINSPYFSYDPTYQIYYISSSNSTNYLVVDSKASSTFAQSGLILSNNYNRRTRVPSYNWGPEGWRLFANASGSLDLASLTGSYQFTNANFTSKGIYPYFSALRTVNNVFYFWPDPNSYNTINRDGSVAIGVLASSNASNTQSTKARLHISVFSSSVADRGKGAWPGTGTVRQLDGAIYVEYGSGSIASPLRRTFFVSGSGNMYSAGTLTVANGVTGSLSGSTFGRIISKNTKATGSFSGSLFGNVVSKNTKASGSFSGSIYGSLKSKNSLLTGSFKGVDNIINFKGTGKKVSFNGTASYAVSSSYALTASYLAVGTGGIPRTKIIQVDARGLGNLTTVYNTTVPHNCPSQPYAFYLNWVAKTTHTIGGSINFTAGDVLNFDSAQYMGHDSGQDNHKPGASVIIKGSNVIVGWPNYVDPPNGWPRPGPGLYNAFWEYGQQGWYWSNIYTNPAGTQYDNYLKTNWYLQITLFY